MDEMVQKTMESQHNFSGKKRDVGTKTWQKKHVHMSVRVNDTTRESKHPQTPATL